MPFLKMDFASFDNSEVLSRKLERLFCDITRPLRYTSRCLFLCGTFEVPKNSWKKFVRTSQITWTVSLSLFIVAAAAISVCKMPSVYYCVYLTGCIDYFFLLYWNRSSKDMEYYKRLKKSSIGTGTLKNMKQMLLRRNVSLVIAAIFSILVFALFTADIFDAIDLLPEKSIPLPLICVYLPSLFLVLFCIPAVNSTVFSCIESVTAEFELIDRDFTHDANKNQLPVARHYLRGHEQLLKMFGVVEVPLSVWCSFHITLNFITIYKVFGYLYIHEYDMEHLYYFWKPALLSFLLVIALLQSLCILYSAVNLRKWILGIRIGMLKVAMSERIPHEQVFPLFSLHLLDMYHRLHGLSFFGLTIIDRHFVIMCVIFAGLAVIYGYHQYN